MTRRQGVRRAWILLSLPLVMGGCAAAFDQSGREWAKPNAQAQQVTFDEMECARDVERLRPPDTIVGGVADAVAVGFLEAHRAADFNGCMHQRGYQRVSS